MSENLTVSYKDCANEKIVHEQPQPKDVPVKPGQTPGSAGKYYQIPLRYDYGGGLVEKEQNGKRDFSIMTSMPLKTEAGLCVEKFQDIHARCCGILGLYKGQIGLGSINFKNSEVASAVFKNPIYYSRDKVTGDLIQGRDPTIFFKCFRRWYSNTEEKTLFVIPAKKMDKNGKVVIDEMTGKPVIDYQPMDWGLIKGSEIHFIPLIHIKSIYVGGGKASLQMEMVSAVLTSIKGRGTSTKQTATIENLVQANPNILSTLEEQVAELTANRQGPLTNSWNLPKAVDAHVGSIEKINPEASTLSNILGSGESNGPTIQSLNISTFPGQRSDSPPPATYANISLH